MKRIGLILSLVLIGCGVDEVDTPAPKSATGAVQVPAALEDPANFVLTPAGYYHRDCVFEIADDATVEADGSITLADGTSYMPAECTHGHYASLAEIGGSIQAEAVEPTLHGWVEDTNKLTTTWFHKLSSTFSVPTAPAHWGNQTVFFFPGFEDLDAQGNPGTIVQPVLQYGASAAGGGKYWSIASWDCNNNCPHGKARRVAVGDVIDGTVEGTSCTSHGACTWTVTTEDRQSGAKSVVRRSEPHAMNWAVTTLEAYNVTRCDELPSSGAEPFDITVLNANNSISHEAWTKWHPAHAPHCSYTTSSSDAGHTYLFWNP